MKKILCIGSITTDIIVTPVDSVPEPGTLRAVKGISQHVGGCAANAAMALGKLGVPSALSCLVGNDAMGDFVRREIGATGVDVSGVKGGETATTVSVVCVSSKGERSFLYNPGSSAVFRAEDVPDELIEECDIIFVAGAMLLSAFDGAPCAALLHRARQLGKLTVMDTAWDFDDVWLPKIAPALRELDIFMPSIDEARKLTGEQDHRQVARALRGLGAKNVIIKLGADGAYMLTESGDELVSPTYREIKPVDTTGAGDSFCAGFLAGLAQELSFSESLALGNAVGTACISAVGASTGIRSLEETREFMRTHTA